jgi:gliding motility-associated-like protein
MHCTVVGTGGDVTITWDANGTASGNFGKWYLYHATALAGPYTLVDSSVVYTDTSGFHATANAGVLPAFYYSVFQPNNGAPVIYSDTIRALGMLLNNPGGVAQLSWNATKNPLVSTNNPYYLIYREYPAGIFTLIDSIDARTAPSPMTYNDLISICDDTIKYKIEVRDSSGCSSVSITKGDRFFDFQVPAIPVIDSVSVDASGNVTVAWLVSTSSDTYTYVILENPGPIAIDSVTGLNSTFLSTPVNATTGSHSFIVIAVDSCGNPSAPSSAHSTIFLSQGFDFCEQAILLNWTPYNFWGTPPTYEILVSVNGGAETVIGTTTNLNFNDTNLISGALFCYRIRSVDVTGKTSTSNQVCFTPNYPPPPAFSYLRKVTVTPSGQVMIAAYVDGTTTVTGYKLLRSESSAGPFSVINSIAITGVSDIVFYDDVPVDQGPYYYYLITIDSCGEEVLTSQVSNTILLEGSADIGFINSMSWNSYSDWPNGVDRYNIYSVVDGVIGSVPIVSITAVPFSFLESVLDNYNSDGEFCYIVEAIEAAGNPNGFSDTSYSNVICIQQSPIIFIPNAFHPGGEFNTVFYPSNSFVSPEGYSFDIFNRWGENIFHTEDPLQGWDGTVNGNQAQEGVYIYRLIAKNPDDSDIELVGSVTLIR